MNNKSVVILPDIHGRTFWKQVVDCDCDIVFLGDYVDPYPFEGIGQQEAIDNFREIVDFAKSRDNVHLLLGNHDCEYYIGQDVCDCRCDYDNYDLIRDMFLSNESLFKFVHWKTVGDRMFVFSHAGFHPMWVGKHSDIELDPFIVDTYMENEETQDRLHVALCDVSYLRGGWGHAGSMIWADIREYANTALPDAYTQVVGHTYLMNKPIGNDNIVCLDLQRPFFINEGGDICEFNGDKIEMTRI